MATTFQQQIGANRRNSLLLALAVLCAGCAGTRVPAAGFLHRALQTEPGEFGYGVHWVGELEGRTRFDLARDVLSNTESGLLERFAGDFGHRRCASKK